MRSPIERHVILTELSMERDRQDAKFGDQTGKGSAKWLAILAEEFGEAAKEVCELSHGLADPELRQRLRVELVQTAAVCVAFLEYGDLDNWWPEEGTR